ncbi:hypothetical protein KP509_11G050700 [Ceratopteris richardii]|uniref:At4g15545-like C-terminal domain-containing protein n=1 Tax=Ceratopteris richardii TaxID=49495 RepID=A0A8T2TUJ7_CERRI|nr:hypothetical protein KP509_11G050700 [Ceratopteris richardii]KAH7425363.1 hypothetical protein KP509_11G050700 [Ceratopteris richardii]KAH7425364.1 hypothetical protein KP509_11G050700 [Ceratopteris richardii]KAH7425365.1 hypothetical protein KP509_11G050700 [Ceratopteris richardii]
MGYTLDSDLPESILAVLPDDPYDQLELARKITSMAVTSRVGQLEAETMSLRRALTEKELLISDLQVQVGELQQALQDNEARLSHSIDEQAKLTTERDALAASVKKLNRNLTKLEIFKRTLINSLHEDDENQAQGDEDKESITKVSTLNSNSSSSSLGKDQENNGFRQRLFMSPTNITPEMTPSGSPKRPPLPTPPRGRSAAVSPKVQSTAGSPPKWHSISDGRFSLPGSLPTSKHSTAPNSPPHGGSHSARATRVDGKEFFRKARNRLSYEQFSAFLTNIKQLNAHLQTKEEALRKASEIFGPENEDLYHSFEGLLRRHLPSQG